MTTETLTPSRNGAPAEASSGQEQTRSFESYVAPAVDIFEEDQRLVLLADLPGVQKDNLEIRFERGILTIQASAGHLASGDPIYREFELAGFFRQFQISDEFDASRCEARLRDGVLRLDIPRAEKYQPRKIQVKASS